MRQIFQDFILSSIAKNLKRVNQNPYHLLILVISAGSFSPENTPAFFENFGFYYINVSLTLGKSLSQITPQYRATATMPTLRNLVEQVQQSGIILDNLGILFDKSLSLRPLKILQEIAKDRTIIAIWQGKLVGDKLTYAEPNHPEYCCEAIDSTFVVKDCSYEV